MAFDVSVSGQLIWISLRGDITNEEILRQGNEIARIELATPISFDRFTDTSETTSHPSVEGISDFAAIRSDAKLKNHVKSAVFAPTDVQYGMARMFQALNRNPLIEVQVFRDKADALKWLGIASGH